MADSSSESLSMSTLLHLVTLKLTPTNYLVWKNHMLPIFAFQNLLGHIDGTSLQPSSTITVEGKTTPNPAASLWAAQDQKTVIILNASLTEEVASEVLGISGARQIWLALESAFSNSSTERMYFLRDTLRQLTKGTSSVTDYSRKFKSICDQLAAIGQPVLELDKFHWFLCGLGPAFENFSVAIRTTKPAPIFRDLVTQAESHEIFMQSIHGRSNPPAAFTAQHQSNNYRGNTSRGRSNNYRGNSYRGGQSNGRGRFYEKRLPHCQICKTHGHSATACPDLHKYARQHSPSDDSLAKVFHAQCHVTNNTPDWNVDSGATAHMTPDFDSLHQSAPYQGSDNKKNAS